MNIQLSKRMQAVADMAVPGYRVADVGCDHGFVSIYLIQAGIAPHVYAADVRPGPLSRAKEHIGQAGLEDYITPVLSDGLAKVPVCSGLSENAVADGAAAGVQAMIAAGIGGRLCIKILSDWIEKTKKLSWMVLEPQSDIHLVRQWLAESGFYIIKENLVYEDGKYYPILFAANEADECWKEQINACQKAREEYGARWEADERAACSDASLTAAGFADKRWNIACDLFGFDSIRNDHPVLKQYLLHTMEKDKAILAGMEDSVSDLKTGMQEGEPVHAGCSAGRIGQRMAEISEKIRICELVLAFMKKWNCSERNGNAFNER